MQTNSSSNTYYNYYDIDLNYFNKTYELREKKNPPTEYKQIYKTLKKIECALKENYRCINNYDLDKILNISRIIFKSRNLFYFSSMRDLSNTESPVTMQNRIENLIHPPKMFPRLTIAISELILSNLLLCKDIYPISLLNREGKQYFDKRILARAKFFGNNGDSPSYFLKNLFKSANKFCNALSLQKYLGTNGERTAENIQKLSNSNFFTNFKFDNKPILHFSIMHYPDLVQFMMNKDTVNQPNGEGRTPLMIATSYYGEKIAVQLIAKGADINHTDNNGNTTLHVISKPNHENINIVQLILDLGGDINAQNNEGNTPLHLAVTGCYKPYVNFLLSRGADLNIYNNKRERALTLIFDRTEFQYCKLTHYPYVEKRVDDNNYGDY